MRQPSGTRRRWPTRSSSRAAASRASSGAPACGSWPRTCRTRRRTNSWTSAKVHRLPAPLLLLPVWRLLPSYLALQCECGWMCWHLRSAPNLGLCSCLVSDAVQVCSRCCVKFPNLWLSAIRAPPSCQALVRTASNPCVGQPLRAWHSSRVAPGRHGRRRSGGARPAAARRHLRCSLLGDRCPMRAPASCSAADNTIYMRANYLP